MTDSHSRKMLIIGNGPSTKELVDAGLDRLPAEFDTFGMGAAYRYFERANWWPTYYALADSKVVHSHKKTLSRLIDDPAVGTERFFFSLPISENPRFELIPHSSTGNFCFKKSIELGYREIYLIGIEGHYVEEIAESRPLSDEEFDQLGFDALNLPPAYRKLLIITKTPSENPNYFFDDYQREGDVYSLPQSKLHRDAWGKMKRLADSSGGRVFNLSAQSAITDFPRMDLNDFLVRTDSLKTSTSLEPALSDEEMEQEYQSIVQTLPTKTPIWLPTERVDIVERLEGIRRVKDIYDNKLDAVYRPKLRALREKYAGRDRCFIIGNGPSLNRTDLSLLKDEVTFAVNGFFLKAPELDWTPSFYVVEDHLVAEDRREWINSFKGPTKLIPAYLGYCFEEDDDTVFFYHRGRISGPKSWDFSRQADEVTYAGCTVTFTCLQLAHFLGFKETYLIGVDADYEIPKDVHQSSAYSVGVLDMQSDDRNHFHPDYFGKGFRWHDPQVSKMVEAYQEAKRVTDQTDQRIYNATVGGRLEVFERRDFHDLFAPAQKPKKASAIGSSEDLQGKNPGNATAKRSTPTDLPRLLVIDLTLIGNGTATGELKASVLNSWPGNSLMQVHGGPDSVWIKHQQENVKYTGTGADWKERLLDRIKSFQPDVVLYRPAARGGSFQEVTLDLVRSSDIPLVTWLMDDLRATYADDPRALDMWEAEWRYLVSRSSALLSIGDEMSRALKNRYGGDYVAISNGVDPREWEFERKPHADGTLLIKYAGSLASNMQLDTVRLIAEASEKLANEGYKVKFEIKSRHVGERAFFEKLKHCSFIESNHSPAQHREWLSNADVSVVAYNFDKLSMGYTRYSIGNKVPECMASAAAILAVGPKEIATIKYLDVLKCAEVVTENDPAAIRMAILKLLQTPEERRKLASRARALAFERHNLDAMRVRMETILRQAASGSGQSTEPVKEHPRGLQVDETAVVAHLLADRRGTGKLMLDVGAHFGTSAAYFDKLGWTIHCFEPDPSNREKLVKRFGSHENVSIDPRAVSNEPAQGVSFFQSEESTGISGLHAFRDTHRESGKVDVTTVAEIVAERDISRVDFLKIDVEGFDFSVLKGVPWDRLQPDVIECEFEDYKTVPLGHTYREVAQFLVDKGYAVYLSEWHPIIRYGMGHDWRRVVPFPGHDLPADAWGNILAFRDDPGLAAVSEAFSRLKKARKPSATQPGVADVKQTVPEIGANGVEKGKPAAAVPTPAKTSTAALGKASMGSPASYSPGFAERMANRLRGNTALYRAGQFSYWLLRNIRRYPLIVLLALVPLVAMAWIGYDLPQFRSAAVLVAAAILGLYALAAMIGFVAQRARKSISILRDNLELQGEAAARAERKTRALARENAALKARLQGDIASLHHAADARTVELRQEVERGLSTAHEHLSHLGEQIATRHEEQNKSHGSVFQGLGDRIAALGEDVDRRLAADRDEREARISSLAEELRVLQTSVPDLARQLAELKASGEAHGGQLEKTTSEIGDLHRHLEEAMAAALRIEGRVGQHSDELIAVSKKVEPLQKRSQKFEHDLDRLAVRNQAVYQRFNRTLSNDQLNRLSTHWSSLLGIKFSRARLAYLANRTCALELMMKGRLATSIETIVLRSMVSAASKRDNLAILEIGTLFGVGAAAVYEAARNEQSKVHLTVLDPLDGYYEAGHTDILTGAQVSETTLRDNFAAVPIPDGDYSVIRLLSTDDAAFEQASKRSYDVLIIDGDHSYEGVKYDFDRYGPLVRTGGYILFDDYDVEEWPDIKRYVDTEISPLDNLEFVGADYRTAVYRVKNENSTDIAVPISS